MLIFICPPTPVLLIVLPSQLIGNAIIFVIQAKNKQTNTRSYLNFFLSLTFNQYFSLNYQNINKDLTASPSQSVPRLSLPVSYAEHCHSSSWSPSITSCPHYSPS